MGGARRHSSARSSISGRVTRFTVTLADGTPLHLMALAPPAAPGAVTVAYDPARVVVMGARHEACPPRLSARGRRGRGRVPRPVLPAAADQGVRRQHPRCLGQELHARELRQRAVEPLLPQRPDQQPHHRGGGLRCSRLLVGVPFAFCLARLPIGGKPVLLALAALPLVLPSFVGAYALVLLFGRSGIVTGALQCARHPVRLDLRREGHHRRLHAHALSLTSCCR